MTAAPRTAVVVFCWDCGYVGNRWDLHHDGLLGRDGWVEIVENLCPECGESCGPEVKVREVPAEDAPDGQAAERE